jgi:hypothetical protein
VLIQPVFHGFVHLLRVVATSKREIWHSHPVGRQWYTYREKVMGTILGCTSGKRNARRAPKKRECPWGLKRTSQGLESPWMLNFLDQNFVIISQREFPKLI